MLPNEILVCACVLQVAWYQTNVEAAEMICLSGEPKCLSPVHLLPPCAWPPFQTDDTQHTHSAFSSAGIKSAFFFKQLHVFQCVF